MHLQWVIPVLMLAGCLQPGPAFNPGSPSSATSSPSLADLLHQEVGSPVTTPLIHVARMECPRCDSATVPADFWVTDAATTVRVHVPVAQGPLLNMKKQNFVPAEGM